MMKLKPAAQDDPRVVWKQARLLYNNGTLVALSAVLMVPAAPYVFRPLATLTSLLLWRWGA